MGNTQEVKDAVLNLATKLDVAKLSRLRELAPELTKVDELLGHNASTALEHMQAKADPLLAQIPSPLRSSLVDLLARVAPEAVQIGLRMLDYGLPSDTLLFMHIDDFLDRSNDTPLLSDNTPQVMKRFLVANPNVHLVVISHDSADVTSVLVSALAGKGPIDNGQVSMVYESGMGLYQGAGTKQKKDYTSGMRNDLLHLLERMAVVAATKMNDKHFKDRFFFSATEYSIGIRVHPFARGMSGSHDKDAARELVRALAVALADLVKEDVQAIESHILNHFLSQDPTLTSVFEKSSDERVWDMEKVDQLLQLFRFVHLGSRGSLIRPADATDVAAADTLLQAVGGERMIVVCSDTIYTKPLLDWALAKNRGFIGCSDKADKQIRDQVETKGGILYNTGHVEELLDVIDAYTHLKALIK